MNPPPPTTAAKRGEETCNTCKPCRLLSVVRLFIDVLIFHPTRGQLLSTLFSTPSLTTVPISLSSCGLTTGKTEGVLSNSLLDLTETFLVQQELHHVLVVQRRGNMKRSDSKLVWLVEV